MASIMSVASILGPLVYSTLYFWSRAHWIGAVWVFSAGIFLLCVPLVRALGGEKLKEA
jgi:DHA1 family tetracycline resistance protein-like MFS transporter